MRPRRTLPRAFWLTNEGDVVPIPTAQLGARGWRKRRLGNLRNGWAVGRRMGDTVEFVCLRPESGLVNRIARLTRTVLRDAPGRGVRCLVGRTIRMVFLRPRRTQVSWLAARLGYHGWGAFSSRRILSALRKGPGTVLPYFRPRPGGPPSPRMRLIVDALRRDYIETNRNRWKDSMVCTPEEMLGIEACGLVTDAAWTEPPDGFRMTRYPIENRKGIMIGLTYRGRRVPLGRIMRAAEEFLGRCGCSVTATEWRREPDFLRLYFVTGGRDPGGCVHAGELQVDGPNVRRAIRDTERA
jgi:hypothetical protein